MASEITAVGEATLLENVVSEVGARATRSIDTTGERFGCGAVSDRERRACSLYLWLLGPTTTQLAADCPCRV